MTGLATTVALGAYVLGGVGLIAVISTDDDFAGTAGEWGLLLLVAVLWPGMIALPMIGGESQ